MYERPIDAAHPQFSALSVASSWHGRCVASAPRTNGNLSPDGQQAESPPTAPVGLMMKDDTRGQVKPQ